MRFQLRPFDKKTVHVPVLSRKKEKKRGGWNGMNEVKVCWLEGSKSKNWWLSQAEGTLNLQTRSVPTRESGHPQRAHLPGAVSRLKHRKLSYLNGIVGVRWILKKTISITGKIIEHLIFLVPLELVFTASPCQPELGG